MEANANQESLAKRLSKPIQFVKGVGPRLAPLLNKLNLNTARDLLFFFPRDYEDVSEICTIEQLVEGQSASACGTIEEIQLQDLGDGRSVLGMLVRGESDYLRAVWFNQPFQRQRFEVGQCAMFSGTPKRRGLCWQMNHPRVQVLDDRESPAQGRIVPIYRLTEGLSQSRLRRIVQQVVDEFASELEEVFPASFLAAHDLWPIQRAMTEIHAPSQPSHLERARRRLVYQELLSLQLALAMRRWQLDCQRQAPALEATAKIDARIRRLFSFELTADQQRAIEEIASDMNRPVPMNRLLQGEVGSGKTIVAEYALLLAVAHGFQAAVMAPTEVLARQHLRVLQADLQQSRVRIGLLTGALPAARRRELQQALSAGEIDILVGTQSLLHDQVEFLRLGLVVIDEQHKFGVRQRAMLKQAAIDPHYLVMTATPIPRTLTMTLFGDLDVSTIYQSPPGRQPVHSYLGEEPLRDKWWQFFGTKLREGRQGYVIAPRVESSQEQEVASVEELYEQLANGPLEAFRIGLLHGRMSPVQKEATMESFRQGRIQVLVATSVIEVGIDVPNATVMTIEGGERFGLAQLHQLRGRIQRGQFPGYVCVFAQPAHAAAVDRLNAFVNTTDGFQLAETDFQQRGPGDLFGTQQHGLPPLHLADLRRDAQLLETARADAQQLFESATPAFWGEEFSRLRQMVLRRYGKSLNLVDVG